VKRKKREMFLKSLQIVNIISISLTSVQEILNNVFWIDKLSNKKVHQIVQVISMIVVGDKLEEKRDIF
jgi:hypothetical protein